MILWRRLGLGLGLGGALAGFACSGGGGSIGGASSGGGGGSCTDFVALTNECASRAGRETNANPAACSDPSAVTPQLQAQIDCALASRDAYCRTIVATFSRDASAISPTDPELVRLNSCIASKTTASPCREAITTLADRCGAGTGFPPACDGQSAGLARCIVDNPAGACAIYNRGAGGTSIGSPEAKAFQQCQTDALRAAIDASSGSEP